MVKDLMTQVACSGCGERFQSQDIKIIAHADDVWFLKADCPGCHAVSLTVAFIDARAVPARPSDLGAIEKRKFKRYPALTGDELLEMHHFLKDFGGDFGRIFGQESAGES